MFSIGVTDGCYSRLFRDFQINFRMESVLYSSQTERVAGTVSVYDNN